MAAILLNREGRGNAKGIYRLYVKDGLDRAN
jgi:hypothetical protein